MYEYSSVSASSYDPGALVAKLNESTAEGWKVVAIVPTGGDVSAFLRRKLSAGEDAAVEAAEEPTAEGMGEEPWATAAVADEAVSGEAAATEEEAVPVADAWAASEAAAVVTDEGSVEVVEETVAVGEAASPAEEPAGWATAPEAAAEAVETTTEESAGVVDDAVAPAGAAVAAATEPVTEAAEAEAPAEASPAPAPAPEAPPTPEPAPVVTTPAGWYPDPSGRFELRYWDGNQWTEHVARAGQQFTDPPVR
jgi:hypothetical protein